MTAEHRATARTALRFACGALLVLAAAHAVSEAADPVFPVLRSQLEVFQERRGEVEAITVGNSHNRGVDFGGLGMPGVHLWRGGHDAFEAVFLARYAADRAPGLRYVFFSASYGMQRVDHAVVGSRDLTERRRELYALVPLRRPIEGDAPHWLAAWFAAVARPDHWEGVVKRTRSRPREAALRADGVVLRRRATMSDEELRRHGDFRARLHRTMGTETLALSPSTPERVFQALDALASTLRPRGMTLVLYTAPAHEAYLEGMDPEAVEETWALLKRLGAANPNVVWMDFSRHPDFAGRNELLLNSDHLNADGARRFSALLRRCLDARRGGAEEEESGCPPVSRPVAFAGAE